MASSPCIRDGAGEAASSRRLKRTSFHLPHFSQTFRAQSSSHEAA